MDEPRPGFVVQHYPRGALAPLYWGGSGRWTASVERALRFALRDEAEGAQRQGTGIASRVIHTSEIAEASA